VTLRTAGSRTITATWVSGSPVVSAGTSAAVTVEGTSIIAPTSVAIGSGFPGQVITSPAFPITWLSTQSDQKLTAVLTGPASDGAGHTIDAADVTLVLTDGVTETVVGTLDVARDIALVTADGTQQVRLRARMPSAAAGIYSVELEYAVVPAP
jgi:hypothetical protein